jgi:hypothetical protein
MKKRTALLSVAVATAVLSLSAGALAQTKVAADSPPPTSPKEQQVAAQSDATGFQVGLYGFGSQLTMNNSLHAVGSSAPDPLNNAHLRFVGQGWMPGGELRIAVLPRDYFGRLRLGFGIGVGGATGYNVTSDALASGVSFKASAFWGARFTGFMGQQFDVGYALDADGKGHHPFFSPYIDLTAIGDITQTTIDLHVKGLGLVGSSTWDAYQFTLAPRAGVIIPLMPNLALDVGGYKSVYGTENYGGYAGITITGP